MKMGSDLSNTGTRAVARSESINLTLAALVAQLLPNGNLVIDGHQQVRVNNELRDCTSRASCAAKTLPRTISST